MFVPISSNMGMKVDKLTMSVCLQVLQEQAISLTPIIFTGTLNWDVRHRDPTSLATSIACSPQFLMH